MLFTECEQSPALPRSSQWPAKKFYIGDSDTSDSENETYELRNTGNVELKPNKIQKDANELDIGDQQDELCDDSSYDSSSEYIKGTTPISSSSTVSSKETDNSFSSCQSEDENMMQYFGEKSLASSYGRVGSTFQREGFGKTEIANSMSFEIDANISFGWSHIDNRITVDQGNTSDEYGGIGRLFSDEHREGARWVGGEENTNTGSSVTSSHPSSSSIEVIKTESREGG